MTNVYAVSQAYVFWSIQDQNLLKWVSNNRNVSAMLCLKILLHRTKLCMQHQIQVDYKEKYYRMNFKSLYLVYIIVSLCVCTCVC